MTEQETKRKKNRRRRRKKKASNAQNAQNVQESLDIEEPVTKKIRLDSQEEEVAPTSQVYTETHLELMTDSKEIMNNTHKSEINNQENLHLNLLFDTQIVSERVDATAISSTLYTNEDKKSHSKTYMITEKDLIQLARIKENEHADEIDVDKHMSGRPIITFSISDNNLIRIELIQDKENDENVEESIGKEQINNFKGDGQIENSNGKNEMVGTFKENEKIDIQIGNIENSEINREIEIQTGFVENSKDHVQIESSIQNGYIKNSKNEYFGISEKKDNLSKLLFRPTSSKHLPRGLEKYWHQRYLLFSLYDEGIMMDEEGWYSVTPEYLAEYLAKRCACDTIIDAMCGVGGNAIQFAKTCKKVIAIDIDETKLYCAKNNASIYGVEDKIEFILGDFYDLVPQLKADVVFLSPPWGGPSYLKSKVYDIKTMIPLDGERLFRESNKITKNIAYYVPRSINFNQMKILCDPDKVCEFQQVIVWDKIKSYVVYYGDLVGNYYSEVIKIPKYWANDTSTDYIQSEETENKDKKRKRNNKN
ncbi:RNA cap guanine-N2 methyltransferase-domain-containing protein [Glomus cerebriforme]|uniref:Trimethylguanosine synthase n=1 Tax=Glomus cerebriforme TaxID=658196 RepID=A0A397SZS5_9GLOM|nr:RNA cap guanine-N2 methyltransferase-domain-containing protein [Glomus cerebriforme]